MSLIGVNYYFKKYLKSISIVVNQCVALLRYGVTWRCVNMGRSYSLSVLCWRD